MSLRPLSAALLLAAAPAALAQVQPGHEAHSQHHGGAPAPAAAAAGKDDVTAAPSCRYCGMDRQKFASSRMVIEYDDGSRVGTCSIHCAAVDLANNLDKAPTALLVGDQATRALVDAEKAVWVLGGDLPGVMTAKAKWAFADRAAAEAFVKAHGGATATFEEAMKSAYEGMYQDTKAIRERRKAMRMKAAEAAQAAGATPPSSPPPKK